MFTISFFFYATQNKISPNIGTLLKGVIISKLTILLCFFLLFCVIFNSFFTIPLKIENARLKLALTIPTGAPITAANDAIGKLPVAIDKNINDLSK